MSLGACDFAEVERRLRARMYEDLKTSLAYQWNAIEEAFMVPPLFLAEPYDHIPNKWLEPLPTSVAKTERLTWGWVEKRKPWFARSRRGWWGWYIYPHLLAALVAMTAYDALWR